MGNLLEIVTKDLMNKKHVALNSLDSIIESLSLEIENKLSI